MATTSEILAVLLPLLWAALNSSSSWVNPRFRIVLPSETRISELFHLISFEFCPGLLAILQASAPPTIQWFLSLSTAAPKDVWGVYVIILKKQGHPDLLYVGSATAAKRGARARFTEYDQLQILPRMISKALVNGYTICHKSLLAWCPIPEASKVPFYRLALVALVALEAVFACCFWAMARGDLDYGFKHLCPWPVNSFSYKGACSHSSFKEGAEGDLDILEEDLQRIADETKQKDLAYQKKYHKQERLDATPKFKAQQARANKKHRPKTMAKQARDRAAKKFHCAVCNKSFGDNGHLKDHFKSLRHKRRYLKSH